MFINSRKFAAEEDGALILSLISVRLITCIDQDWMSPTSWIDSIWSNAESGNQDPDSEFNFSEINACIEQDHVISFCIKKEIKKADNYLPANSL